MLVLSRKQNEAIVIGGSIRVVVVEIKKGVVRLGVEAEKDVVIDREELHEAKKRGQRSLD